MNFLCVNIYFISQYSSHSLLFNNLSGEDRFSEIIASFLCLIFTLAPSSQKQLILLALSAFSIKEDIQVRIHVQVNEIFFAQQPNYNLIIQIINMKEQDGIENLIEILNSGVDIHKEKKQKKKGQEKKASSNNNEGDNHDEDDKFNEEIGNIASFAQIYEKRMEKVEKKNQERQAYEKRKKQMMEAAKQKYSNKEILIPETIKLPTIRYLVFKNWSGNHLEYEVKDSPYKFKFTNGVVGLVKHLLQQNGFVETSNNDASIIWNIGVVTPSVYQALGAYTKINHFPKTYEITRKDLMLVNLSKMKNKHPAHYNFFPVTYILPNEISAFVEDSQKQKSSKWYIVKPHNKSQGKGIWISNSPEQILKKQKQCIVVSEYIHNPFLVNGLKFDMRIYVAITCFNPLRIYIYEDGLARFATSEYSFDLSTKENLFAHLTNYSLNKFSENFVPNDDPNDACIGHKWSLPALKEFLMNQGHDISMIWGRIEDMIIKTIISIQGTVFASMQMNVPYRDNCFQVLGFDILLDDAFRPWLLEINLSPSLNTDSGLDLKIKGSMISDLFTMMGVVAIDQRFSVDKSYFLNDNKLFTHKQSKNQWVKLEKLVIKESQEEIKRSGGWRRIFPTETAIRYKPFFDTERPLNRLLRDEELKKVKSKAPNFNQALKTINQNPLMEKKKK